jgi:hypothetical protein
LIEAAFPSLIGDEQSVHALQKLSRAAATPNMAGYQYRHIFGKFDARGSLEKLDLPTLILWSRPAFSLGGEDWSAKSGKYLAEHIDGARSVEVAGDDSFLFGGDHDIVINEVAAFLTGHGPPAAAERFLTTVLFTDIVGSTEGPVALGDQKWRELLDAHDRTVRDQLERYRGREIKTTGDGFLACFDSPARAVHCAHDIVQASRRLGIEIRAGIHTGECEGRQLAFNTDGGGCSLHTTAVVPAITQGEGKWQQTTRL